MAQVRVEASGANIPANGELVKFGGKYYIGDGATTLTALAATTGANIIGGIVKIEGGGVVVIGATNPTSAGANTGADSLISGGNNYNNSGKHCSISGYYNDSNSGHYCSISGRYNYNNSGNYCQISGHNNKGNFGTHSIIGGGGYFSTKFVTSGGTATEADNKILTTAHGLANGDTLRFISLTGGDGLTVNTTTYYVINEDTDDFEVSETKGGAAVDITTDYTDVQYIAKPINYGNYCLISGLFNHSNSGFYCSISGFGNHS
ncbi:hypothetical protein N9955_01100, partial [bacterium]|nr:hypothetical protein [bacterium]